MPSLAALKRAVYRSILALGLISVPARAEITCGHTVFNDRIVYERVIAVEEMTAEPWRVQGLENIRGGGARTYKGRRLTATATICYIAGRQIESGIR